MTIRILVLEDDNEDWLRLQELFHEVRSTANRPFELVRVKRLAEARQCMQEAEFHILVADYYLPDGAPPELLNKALMRQPHLHIMLISNDAHLVTRQEVGELLRVPRVSFYVKGDLGVGNLHSELNACAKYSEQSATGFRSKRKILLIDDDPEELDILAWHCEKIDEALLEVDWVPNSQDALEKARSEHYDLILVDYRLTGEVGTDVVESLHDCGIETTIMLIAGSASFFSSQKAMRCLGHQRAGFISKKHMDEDRLRQALNISRDGAINPQHQP